MDIKKKLEADFNSALIKALATNLYVSMEAYQRMCSENKIFLSCRIVKQF